MEGKPMINIVERLYGWVYRYEGAPLATALDKDLSDGAKEIERLQAEVIRLEALAQRWGELHKSGMAEIKRLRSRDRPMLSRAALAICGASCEAPCGVCLEEAAAMMTAIKFCDGLDEAVLIAASARVGSDAVIVSECLDAVIDAALALNNN